MHIFIGVSVHSCLSVSISILSLKKNCKSHLACYLVHSTITQMWMKWVEIASLEVTSTGLVYLRLHKQHDNQTARRRFSWGLLGVTWVTPADLSPTIDFILLDLNCPIVKFILFWNNFLTVLAIQKICSGIFFCFGTKVVIESCAMI